MMSLPKVACQMLEKGAEVRLNPHPLPTPKRALIEQLTEVDAVIADGLTVFDAEVMKASPRLKVIARYGVGYDNVDLEAARASGIYVTFTPGVLSEAVAELTVGLMLCLSRRLIEAHKYVKGGAWAKGDYPFPLGTDLCGKVVGIVGLGRIGAEVARRTWAFKMCVLYNDLVRNTKAEQLYGARLMDLGDLLRASDFVTLHVALSPQTERLIGAKELRLMKPTAYLINTSRGRVIDQTALVEALRLGKIAGAALDVFDVEPIPEDDLLLGLDNVVLMPHVGSATSETRVGMAEMAVKDVIRVLKGERPNNIANRELAE